MEGGPGLRKRQKGHLVGGKEVLKTRVVGGRGGGVGGGGGGGGGGGRGGGGGGGGGC